MEWLNKGIEEADKKIALDPKKSQEVNERMFEVISKIKKESAWKQKKSQLQAQKIILNS